MGLKRQSFFVAGIDGGGTKTACMIADKAGNILGSATAGGSNHQICGIKQATENVCRALQLACENARVERGALANIYLGMAGADSPDDFALLNGALKKIFGDTPFTIVNDTWIAFACEADRGWGAISICGTGNNLAVKDKTGKIYPVRALRYALGNSGGGHHLTEIALHWAFRCHEHTGPDTRLVEMLPAVCGCSNMDELAHRVYTSDYQYPKNFNVPKLVFDLALEGDEVCRSITTHMGEQLGSMLGHLITWAGLAAEQIPVVLAGGQYTNDTHRQMIAPLEKVLLQAVPKAQIKLLQCPSVVGALLKALEEAGVCLSAEGRRRLFKTNELE